MSDLLVLRDKVTRFTTRIFDDVQIDEEGALLIPVGSTRIFVQVTEVTDPEVLEYRTEHDLYKFSVIAYSVVLYGVEGTPDFFKWVACEGAEYWLGQFRAIKQRESDLFNLVFQVRLVADELDETELRSVLWAIAVTSNGEDEELQQRFGGSRAIE